MQTPAVSPSLELLFPSEFGFEKVARAAIGAFALRLGFGSERVEDIKTALGEACVNAIEHGNQREPDLRVLVRCQCDDQRLRITVCDQGRKRYLPAPIPSDIESRLAGLCSRRGMGLMIISQLADESGYEAAPDGGNQFWFVVRRSLHGSTVSMA